MPQVKVAFEGGQPIAVNDGLANVMTGAGTTVDRKMGRQWTERYMNEFMVETAFRGSWLMRKIVRIPVQDALRNWIDWQAKKEEVAALEAEEKRLKVKEIIRAGMLYGRLGGGVVIMGVREGDASAPLDGETLGQGSLRYLKAYSRHRIKLGPIVNDPNDDDFGEPESFILKGKGGAKDVEIHRSRVIVFKGEFSGDLTDQAANTTGSHPYWGESIVHSVNDAVMNAMEAQDEIAGLISEAKLDIYGIPDLMTMMGDSEAEKRVMRRLELANLGKSTHRAIIRDAAESWDQRQITWGGMPQVIMTFVTLAASASDIPATRLIGKSPDGMNATGDGDQENYDQLVQDIQQDRLNPALDKLHTALIPSALGAVPGEGPDAVYYTLAPLHEPSAKDAAEVEGKEAASYVAIVNTGTIPEAALAEAQAQRMIESGRWPGLEAALEKIGPDWAQLTLEGPEEDDDDLEPGDGPGGGNSNSPDASSGTE